ncbi:MAG: DinB family protein [Armatimonadota bacterium]
MAQPSNNLTITDIMRRQLIPAIKMLQDIIEQCPDDLWTAEGENPPVWEQAYHSVFWLNAWARDWSTPFEKPEFHSDAALDLLDGASPIVTREQMLDYLRKAESECMSFLDGLSDEMLTQEIEAFGCKWTPADRIIGQASHIQHHVGIIYAAIRQATSFYPKWIGFNE